MNRIPLLGQWLWWWTIPVCGDPVREHGEGSLTGDSERKTIRYILKEM